MPGRIPARTLNFKTDTMKRPLSDQSTRWMMIHAPDSLTAAVAEASLAKRKLGREFLGIFVPYLAKILPSFMEIKQPYRKYL